MPAQKNKKGHSKKEEQMNKILKLGTFTGAFSVLAAPAVFADTQATIVSPTSLHDWTDASIAGGSVTYADGSPAGLGSSSLELKTMTDTASKAVYAHPEDMKLSDLQNASYWTKQIAASSDGGSAAMTLGVDLNGDGSWDTNLVFEPYWQNDLSPDAAPVVKGEWQEWNVKDGMFWSSKAYGSGEAALIAGSGGAPFYSLQNILANYPDARLTGVGVNVGSYNLDYTIDVDGVKINGTTYDFERTNPTPTDKDQCKKDGWKALKNVDGRMFNNQGQCVSFVASDKAHVAVDSDNNQELKADANTNIQLQTR